MRLAFFCLFTVAGCSLLAGADDPTDAEQKALESLKSLKPKMTALDPELHKEARIKVTFEAISDATVASLVKHPEIGDLHAYDSTACTAKGFAALKGLPNLRRLVLYKAGVSDKELAELAACKQLRVLVLNNEGVPPGLSDAGLAAVKDLNRLEQLDLTGNAKVTDKGMAFVKSLERLESLYLNKTGITDKGLFELKPLEGLRTLNVAGTKVTAEAAEKFPNLMPNLRKVQR